MLNAGWFYDPDYEWGIGSSPIIWKNLVIVQCDIQKGSFLAAFDVADGAPVWRTAREEIPSWSTPAIYESDGHAELITQATTFTRGYDPSTGKELWRLSGNSEITIPTPIIGPGLIIVTNGYTRVQPIFAIKPGAMGDITLKGDQTQNQAIAWSTTRGGPYIPTPIIYGEQLYVLGINGVLTAYNVRSGERIYQARRLVQRITRRRGRKDLRRQRRRRRFRRQGGAGVRAARDQRHGSGGDGDAGDLERDHLRAWFEGRVRHRHEVKALSS